MSNIIHKINVNPKESEELQLYLFKKGIKWNSGVTDIRNTDAPYLCIYSDRTIAYSYHYEFHENIIDFKDFIKMSKLNDKMYHTKSGDILVYIGEEKKYNILKYEINYKVVHTYLGKGSIYNKYFLLENNKQSVDIREDSMYNFVNLKDYRKLKLDKLNNA